MNIFVYLCNPDRKIEGKVLANSYGVIAQLVEQRTENPCVPGSIPGDTTLKSESYRNVTLFFLCVKELGFPKRLNKMVEV